MIRTSNELLEAYEARTPGSRRWMSTACRYLPGGDTRASAHYPPYPVVMLRGEGCRLVDLDGLEYLDFMNNFTSLIHGHAHPPIVKAVTEQVARGTAHAAPVEEQLELARLLCERVPGVDLVRFASSGSEATLMALRAARAFTGRQKIVKVEGGYHGSHDHAEVSMIPLPGVAGPADRPHPIPLDASIAESALGDVIPIPFNAPDVARARIAEQAGEIAAVIVEPILGALGMLPADPDFLRALREAADAAGALLIFDEVIALRLGFGGAGERLGVRPDLTAMGKIIGGGLPIGAFGGRRELMEPFDPARPGGLFHASTFSGNALSMAAGLAAMRDVSPDVLARIDALGEHLRAGFDHAFERAGIRGRATGMGSLSQLHLTDAPLHNARDTVAGIMGAGAAGQWLHLSLLRRGLFLSPRGMCVVSTAMGPAEVDAAIAALDDALTELRPVLEREQPTLLR
jgi:glutamate-1-semialdehyde 2,1-aminomutase